MRKFKIKFYDIRGNLAHTLIIIRDTGEEAIELADNIQYKFKYGHWELEIAP